MNKLTLIMHGRCGSTLLLNWLYSTELFTLWGNVNTLKDGLGECPLTHHLVWSKELVQKEWRKIRNKGKYILSKLPEFCYIVPLLLPLQPDIIVIERNIEDKIRSTLGVGWGELEVFKKRAGGILDSAHVKYAELGGRISDKYCWSLFVNLAVLFCYGQWKARKDLENYSHVLYVTFEDLMFRDEVALSQIERFLEISNLYRVNWVQLKNQKLQDTGRKNFDFTKKLPIPFPEPEHKLVRDIVERFGCS